MSDLRGTFPDRRFSQRQREAEVAARRLSGTRRLQPELAAKTLYQVAANVEAEP